MFNEERVQKKVMPKIGFFSNEITPIYHVNPFQPSVGLLYSLKRFQGLWKCNLGLK